jgi:hypothetical protein
MEETGGINDLAALDTNDFLLHTSVRVDDELKLLHRHPGAVTTTSRIAIRHAVR